MRLIAHTMCYDWGASSEIVVISDEGTVIYLIMSQQRVYLVMGFELFYVHMSL